MEYDHLQFCDWTLLLLTFSVHSFHLPLLCIRDNNVRGDISRQGRSGRGRGTALPSHSVTLWTLETGPNILVTGPHQPVSQTAVREALGKQLATAICPGGRISDQSVSTAETSLLVT